MKKDIIAAIIGNDKAKALVFHYLFDCSVHENRILTLTFSRQQLSKAGHCPAIAASYLLAAIGGGTSLKFTHD